MSKTKKNNNYVTYVEDAEEDSGSSVEGIEGTRKYALSEAPSPTKERPNTGKSRSERRPSHRRSETSSEGSLSLTDSSNSTARSSRKEKEAARRLAQKEAERELIERERRRRERKLKEQQQEEERRKAEARAAQKDPKAMKKTRPTSTLKHAASTPQPVVQQPGGYRRGHVDDPSCYGVAQPAASSSRPRAQTRPASYYAGQTSRPPIANMGWHQSHQPMAPYPPVVGTFPPPAHMLPPPSPMSQMSQMSQMSHMGPSPSPLPVSGYFDAAMGHRDLKHRFETRPSSAMGYQASSVRGFQQEEYEDDYLSSRPSRRTSSRKIKHDDDRKMMPPPNYIPRVAADIPRRPQSAVPQSSPFAAPPPPPTQTHRPPSRRGSRPPPAHRRSVGFVDQVGYDDEDFGGEIALFHDVSPRPPQEPRRTPSGRSRRVSNAYDQQALEVLPVNARTRTVATYGGNSGGGVSLGASYEGDSYMNALQYQEDVSGPSFPLTAENVRKAAKRGGTLPSSRSTRSSGSHDDSDYKRSNTTGITRSSSGNNEDVIIKFAGRSVVRLPGAEIECSDGEIMLSSIRGVGSDRASTIFQIEDGRSRVERKALPHRIRAPSQSDSQSRGYAPSHAPYDPTLNPDYF